jgi:hypothetical protein
MVTEVRSPINRESNAAPMSPGSKSNPSRASADAASLSQSSRRKKTHGVARSLLHHWKNNPVGRGWRRVRGTPPGVQTWESEPYSEEIIQADTNVAGDQLRHAKQQLALGRMYPGRECSLPSAKIIGIEQVKRAPKT